MSMLQDARAAGMAALHLPHPLQRHGCGTIRYVAEHNARYPVLLVHGYAATESVWTPRRRALVRWLAYYSDADRVVSSASARLDDPRYGAANLLIPGCGHLTICRDVRLIRSLVPELIRTETLADAAASTDAGRELMAA
jgi:hypothetical protein